MLDQRPVTPITAVSASSTPITSAPTASGPRRVPTDAPVPLPAARGPVSAALIDVLSRRGAPVDPDALTWSGELDQAPVDDDLQLALWLAYEQHYRGLADVEETLEWDPGLIVARTGWEQHFVRGLRQHVAARDRGLAVVDALNGLASADAEPSLSKFLMREATSTQFAEFLAHRSIYHLKEADPHSWAIPRLSGSPKGALITIQSDEYGSGVPAAMHAQLFRALLQAWDLRTSYAGYLDHVPGVTLMATNLISLFGLHRRWRGALVGHLTLFEMTSSTPNARYARGHRRLDRADRAAMFFDEHVVADAVHEQIALHDLAAGLSRAEPQLSADIVFGAECAAYADRAFGSHLLEKWAAGRSSLRRGLEQVAA